MIRNIFMIALCAGVTVAAAAMGWQEARLYLRGGYSGATTSAALVQNAVGPVWSAHGNQTLLFRCEAALSSAYMRSQNREARAALSGRCLEIAQDLTALAPSDSGAWMFAARFAMQQGDFPVALEALYRSQETGPNEQWVAEGRVQIAEVMLDLLPPETAQNHTKDLKMLVQTRRGVGSIAGLYVRNTDFRERIISIVETMPRKVQARFLRNVRDLTAAQTSGG